MNSVELFYAIELPKHFCMEHPLGTVLGRAQYGDYFFFYQGCTVGGNNSYYPVIGNNVTMYSNSKVLGNSHIGDNVVIGANAYIKDTDIPENSIVFGQYPDNIIKSSMNNKIDDINKSLWS
jgi:serine O-acetyltransferase